MFGLAPEVFWAIAAIFAGLVVATAIVGFIERDADPERETEREAAEQGAEDHVGCAAITQDGPALRHASDDWLDWPEQGVHANQQ